MTETMTPNDALLWWKRAVTRSLRTLPHDLSQRQFGVLLSVYMAPPPHTIRSLSEQLHVSKPAICRAVDALCLLDLVRRKKDENDRRNVLIQRTIAGSVFLRDFADIVVKCNNPASGEQDDALDGISPTDLPAHEELSPSRKADALLAMEIPAQ